METDFIAEIQASFEFLTVELLEIHHRDDKWIYLYIINKRQHSNYFVSSISPVFFQQLFNIKEYITLQV